MELEEERKFILSVVRTLGEMADGIDADKQVEVFDKELTKYEYAILDDISEDLDDMPSVGTKSFIEKRANHPGMIEFKKETVLKENVQNLIHSKKRSV